jgi:hypothetical protein
MDNTEFSNEFDILYNNIASNQAPGLDEYEKSVFLTTAQDAVVLDLYKGNSVDGKSFEETEELRQYLSSITKTEEATSSEEPDIIKISDKSYIYDIPEDLWFITHESVKCKDKDSFGVEVFPVTQDTYTRISKNPFRKTTKNRVLRLNISDKIELVSEYPIESYVIRYITKLEPIVLSDLPNGLSIKGVSDINECKLNPALHSTILLRAVELAKISMGLNGGK